MKGVGVRRILPAVVFIAVAVVGISLSASVYYSAVESDKLRFQNLANEAADRVNLRVTQHISLLHATHSLFVARGGAVSRDEFAAFIANLEASGQFEGLQGIGYAELTAAGSEASLEASLKANYNIDRAVFPPADSAARVIIKILEPQNERNGAALGYDMYSQAQRRAAILRAAQTGELSATGRVDLVQEIDKEKQAGFLVYMPVPVGEFPSQIKLPGAEAGPSGFIYAPFRAGDLHRAALARGARLPISMATYDEVIAPENLLFKSAAPAASAMEFKVERETLIGGRRWIFVIEPSADFKEGIGRGISFLLGAISLLAAAAIAASTRSQMKALDAADELYRVSEKATQEKDMLLQEMKHRIKNSIARVLAIARQTAKNAESLADFSQSFTNRLQAMATSQDLLTRSRWQRADLEELLSSELNQVFGGGGDTYQLAGPPVELNERATQALGLTFHELGTNALKYADITTPGNRLDVSWRFDGQGGEKKLVIEWLERTAQAIEYSGNLGFGTRLIDTSIRDEIGGVVERQHSAHGLQIRIVLPAAMI